MKKLFTLLLPIIMMITIVGCGQTKELSTSKTYDSFALSSQVPIIYDEASFMVNVDNPEEIVSWGDYVFVAKVESELRTEYTDIYENDNGSITGKPYTVYSITVIDNIKGKLKKNVEIEFFKHGGVNYDGKSISLLDGDKLLECGKYYILVAAAESDGRLGQGIPNAAIELDAEDKHDIVSNAEYKKFKKYVKNEVKFERKRFVASDEE